MYKYEYSSINYTVYVIYHTLDIFYFASHLDHLLKEGWNIIERKKLLLHVMNM